MGKVDTLALNKKLAAWAGLKYDENGGCCPTDNDYFCFTESFDACFKWLWDKAVKILQDWDGLSEQHAYRLLADKWFMNIYKSKGEKALALCLAIEKLIDDS